MCDYWVSFLPAETSEMCELLVMTDYLVKGLSMIFSNLFYIISILFPKPLKQITSELSFGQKWVVTVTE